MPLEAYMGQPSLLTTTSCLAAFATALIYTLLKRSKHRSTPPSIGTLRGPKADSFLWGSLPVVLGPSDRNKLAGWVDEFGAVFVFRSILGSQELVVADPKSMSFILNRPMEFQRSGLANGFLKSVVGHGLLAAEGLTHRRQVCLRTYHRGRS